LRDAGCTTFFAATLPESIELRMLLGASPTIAMLNGFAPQDAELYHENTITPVLNDIEQVNAYQRFSSAQNTHMPAIAHIDTGMNRLGIHPGDMSADMFDGLNIRALMSHFISSEEKESPLNPKQNKAFQTIVSAFPAMPKSLCNSAGIFLSDDYHYDMVRPGMALYGLNPTPYAANPMHDVVTLDAKILQIHSVRKNETAGYNATYRFEKDSAVAIVDIGYADGLFRKTSNTANLSYNGIACPIRGNVSMDLTIIDLANIPESQMPKTGDMVEVIGPNQSADDLARDAQTIGYEILTSLSRRFERNYT